MFPIPLNDARGGWGEHDPEAAAAAHDPTRQPWASMDKASLIEAARNAATAAEYDALVEFIHDKSTAKELEVMTQAGLLTLYLAQAWDAAGIGQINYLTEIAERVSQEIANGLPPIGPPELCN